MEWLLSVQMRPMLPSAYSMAKKVPLSQRRRCFIRPVSLVTASASATASLMYSSRYLAPCTG